MHPEVSSNDAGRSRYRILDVRLIRKFSPRHRDSIRGTTSFGVNEGMSRIVVGVDVMIAQDYVQETSTSIAEGYSEVVVDVTKEQATPGAWPTAIRC